MKVKTKSLIVLSFNLLAITCLLFQSCSKPSLEDEVTTNPDLDSIIMKLFESDEEKSIISKIYIDQWGEIHQEQIKPSNTISNNIVRLKFGPHESSNGDEWEDSHEGESNFLGIAGGTKFYKKKLKEYGGKCIETRTENYDDDNDGDNDRFKVYTRKCQ